ncbi:MAG: 23S rRNA (uracil(1939)-C(5))-methyltransferase RlmD [Oscillospiraceae bacterium]|nr:23S rRNA (uracil(1939)-C(5))-methyltransferase RlmD [Oscillospiraceae bacterium]
MIKKNDIFTAEVVDYTSEGLGVCRYDGQAVFVRGAARGDVLEVRVVKATGRAVWGRIERITEPSEHRIDTDCAVFPACGGCDLRHVGYGEELRFKREKVERALRKIGGVEISAADVIGAEALEGYRNKAVIPVGRLGDSVVTGYYRARSHDIVPHENCKINAPEINICAGVTREFLERYRVDTARHLMVRAVDGGVQAALVVKGGLENGCEWVEMLREKCPNIKSVLVIENPNDDNVPLRGEIECLWGELTLIGRMGAFEFELHPFAFAQVNTQQAVRLYDLAREYAGEYGSAADLFCGAGTLTLWMARGAGRVAGVESVPEAVECARRNAVRSGAGNVEFILGDAGAVKLPRTEVVTVDPPRSGMDLAAVEAVAAAEPERIIYVSCDPATLARDVKLFGERGYKADRLGIVDMFPRTRHTECVVRLKK